MRSRLCVFICSCLLALGLVGCFTPEEAAITHTSFQRYGEAKKTVTEKEVQPLNNALAIVPVRDPFVPLITASVPGEAQTDKGTEPNAGQKISIELIAVYQKENIAYASLRDGKQLADAAVGETFSGYEVTKIDLQNNQVALKKGGQIVVIKNCSSTK